MGIFNSFLKKLGLIKDKAAEVVAGNEAAAAEAPTAPDTVSPVETAPAPEVAGAAAEVAAPAPEVAAEVATVTPADAVDVIAVCEELASKNPQKLNWKVSIVDLMKLLGIDPSLANRKALADELGCPKELIGGDYAQMNIWLHKAVMKKLAENGGKVPAELTD